MAVDHSIRTLLDLHDSILDQEGGYWIKIEAWEVPASPTVPHGIRYSLTLHEPSGERILGYDNAHAVKPGNKFKYAGQVLAYDHRHRSASDKGTPYSFSSAEQLMKDFFDEVDRVLEEVRRK